MLEWLLLAAAGGLAGLVLGALLGRASVTWRPALVLFLFLAGSAAAGWIVAGARETVDCEDGPSFCAARYG
ncbi:MAG: hypothetical protein M3Q68_03040 [Actinomycetota bacterium]|nr:hypothetical protein [Actinomycetota bacterium]